jgi:hypothetical protein
MDIDRTAMNAKPVERFKTVIKAAPASKTRKFSGDGDYYMWRIEKRSGESGAQGEIVSLDAERLVRLAERIGQKEIERNGGKE